MDEQFRVKYQDLPSYLKDWLGPEFDWSSAEVMDFGCGEGVMALGVAHQLGCRRVVGVDIGDESSLCRQRAREHLRLESLPENLSFHRVKPGSLHQPGDYFDLIYSWSVFEHVDQRLLAATLESLRNALKPGGYLFVQIAPLYYSAEGSHLYEQLREPWAHLHSQLNLYRARLRRAVGNGDLFQRLWSTYQTLNRITAPELEAAITSAGFEIVRRYTTETGHEVPPSLLLIYREDVLKTEQIVLLGRRS